MIAAATPDDEPADCTCPYCTEVRRDDQLIEADRDARRRQAERLLRADPEYLDWCAEVARRAANERRNDG